MPCCGMRQAMACSEVGHGVWKGLFDEVTVRACRAMAAVKRRVFRGRVLGTHLKPTAASVDSCQTAYALKKKTSLTSFHVLGEVKLFDVKNACDEQSMLPCVLGEVKLFDVKNACDEQSMLPCLRSPCSLSFLLFEIILKFL